MNADNLDYPHPEGGPPGGGAFPRSNARYELLSVGCDRVELVYDASQTLSLDGSARALVQQRCHEARQAGRKVDNHPLYRLLNWRLTPQGLLLETGAVDYETYFGMSRLEPRFHPAAPQGDPRVEVVAVAAATDVDGHLVLERRGQRVAQGAGMLHVKPSGHMHPPQTPWQAVVAETEEELGLQECELLRPELLGLVRSLTAPCVVLLYRFKAALSWDDLLRRQAVDAWEYEQLLALRIEPDVLEAWLVENFASRATGPGHAAVLLEGRARYGDTWFERVWGKLAAGPRREPLPDVES